MTPREKALEAALMYMGDLVLKSDKAKEATRICCGLPVRMGHRDKCVVGAALALPSEAVGDVDELRAQIATMNARIALDAKSYERDQYLIGQLRAQLKAASLRAEGGRDQGAIPNHRCQFPVCGCHNPEPTHEQA